MTTEVSDDDFQEILAQTRRFVRTAVVPREQEILADDRVPEDLREQAKKMGLFGYAIPQEWGGLGLNLVQDVERDGAGLHIAGTAVNVRHEQRHRRSGFRRFWHGRPEGPLVGDDGHRRRGGLLRADGARRGIESVRPTHESRSRWRRLDHQLTEAFHHKRSRR